MLTSFFDGRRIYFLKVVDEDQLLNGTGTGGDLYGLVAEATDCDNADAGDNQIDAIRGGIKQVQGQSRVNHKKEKFEAIKEGTKRVWHAISRQNQGRSRKAAAM